MRNKLLLILVLPILIGLVHGASTFGQVVYGQPAAAGTGFTYTHFKTTVEGVETTISQFMMPLSGFVPVQDNFDVGFYVANSSNTLDALNSEMKLNGLGDARFQANHSFANDQVLVGLGVNLPTGKRKLDLAEEEIVLQALSINFLEFPMRRFGEGFGFNFLLGGATMLGENIRGGAGISYQFLGKYKPYTDYGDYNPGDAIALNLGGDLESGAMTWRVDGIYTLYTADKLDGEQVFKQSPQIDLTLSAVRAAKATSVNGFVRYVARGDNKTYDSTGAELTPYKLYGNEFSVGAGLMRKFDAGWSVLPNAGVKLISGANGGLDKSHVFDFGSDLYKEFNENFIMSAGFKYYTGTADGGNIDVSGYQLTLGLTASM